MKLRMLGGATALVLTVSGCSTFGFAPSEDPGVSASKASAPAVSRFAHESESVPVTRIGYDRTAVEDLHPLPQSVPQPSRDALALSALSAYERPAQRAAAGIGAPVAETPSAATGAPQVEVARLDTPRTGDSAFLPRQAVAMRAGEELVYCDGARPGDSVDNCRPIPVALSTFEPPTAKEIRSQQLELRQNAKGSLLSRFLFNEGSYRQNIERLLVQTHGWSGVTWSKTPDCLDWHVPSAYVVQANDLAGLVEASVVGYPFTVTLHRANRVADFRLADAYSVSCEA